METYLATRIEQVANSGGNNADTVRGCVERLIKEMAIADGPTASSSRRWANALPDVMIPDHELSLRDKLEAGFDMT